ncbi:hypothetical protein ABNP32_03425 [Pseudomonas viridiflava]
MAKYLLVAEGPTDHVVISELAAKLSELQGRLIEVAELAPRADATSGSYPAFGWNAIEKWCKRYRVKTPEELEAAPAALRETLRRNTWKGMLGIQGADGIIIQMDNDIAHEISTVSAFVPGACRSTHCKTAMTSWLGESVLPDDVYLAISAVATETWILAAYAPDHAIFADLPKPINYEQIEDCEERLIGLGLKSKKKNGRRRLLKNPYTIYESYAKTIVDNLAVVRERCPALESLCSHLSR